MSNMESARALLEAQIDRQESYRKLIHHPIRGILATGFSRTVNRNGLILQLSPEDSLILAEEDIDEIIDMYEDRLESTYGI